MPRTESSYTRRQEGEESIFSVTPGAYADGSGPTGLIVAIVLTVICLPVGIVLLILKLASRNGGTLALGKRKALLRPVTIRVRPSLLTLPHELTEQSGRASITGNDLHRLVVRNYISMDTSGTQLVGQGMLAGANQMGHTLRRDMANHMGWAVDAEAGSRAYTLAFGLSEVTANGLMEDIHRALNG